MITRRDVLFTLGASACAVPFASFAQQPPAKLARIGILGGSSAGTREDEMRAALRGVGYLEGKNIVLEFRWADGKFERLNELATELVHAKADIIITQGTDATKAAQKATTTIPIVMTGVSDPLGSGLIRSLARPGGNTTGPSVFVGDTITKHLEMLNSIVPKLSRVTVLVNPLNSSHSILVKNLQTAAQKIGVTLLTAEARTTQEIEQAFSMMNRQHAQALIVLTDPTFNLQARQIAQLALKYRLPCVARQETVRAGGLMSYGAADGSYGRSAVYVDKILKGAKPADLPVEQPMRFELVINGKTAKALGLTIPPDLLVRADKVIE